MKKFNLFFAFVCVFAMSAALFAQDAQEAAPAADPVIAEESGSDFPLWASLTLGTDSKYVCDGLIANRDQVLWYDITIGAYGLYLGIWTQNDMTDVNNRKYRYEEVDYTIGYAHTFDAGFSPITLDFKWQYFQYPGEFEIKDDHILKATVTIDNVLDPESDHSLGFGAFLKYNYQYNWSTGDVWAVYGYKINEKLSASLTATLHWYDRDKMNAFGESLCDGDFVVYKHNYYKHARIHGFELKPAVNYQINDHLSISGYVACNWFVTKSVREAVQDKDDLYNTPNDSPNTWAGVALNFSF